MYWLAVVVSIAGSPDIQMEMKMGSFLHVALQNKNLKIPIHLPCSSKANRKNLVLKTSSV